MLSKGQYTLKEIISVSRSLSTVLEEHKQEDIYKCVLEKESLFTVVYFIGNVDFGKKSVISLEEDKKDVLLYPDDYTIIKNEELKINKKLVQSLLTRNESIK